MVEGGEALLVCDSLKGLLRVELGSGRVTVLSNRVTDRSRSGPSALPGPADAINYANDLDTASDGTVFFSSSTAGVVAQHPAGFYVCFLCCLCRACPRQP